MNNSLKLNSVAYNETYSLTNRLLRDFMQRLCKKYHINEHDFIECNEDLINAFSDSILRINEELFKNHEKLLNDYTKAIEYSLKKHAN